MQRRERYRMQGAGTFGDTELLALLIGTGSRGRTSLQIAAGLLDRFGGLAGLTRCQAQELMAEPGVGQERSVRVLAALEAGRRALDTPRHPAPVFGPDDAFDALGPGLRGLGHEELHALFLDRRRRPVAHRRLTRGSDAYTVVDPRQVFRIAIGVGAHAVVIAHNHPSGDPTPSSQDVEITRRLAHAGRVLGIPLVDHLVVGADAYVSMAGRGQVPAAQAAGPGWLAEHDRTPACTRP